MIADGFLVQALSRAYYAMHWASRALLSSIGEKRSSHSGTIGAVGQYFAKPGKLARHHHQNLAAAFDRRQEADYVMGGEPTEAQTAEVIGWATEFVDAVTEHLERDAE